MEKNELIKTFVQLGTILTTLGERKSWSGLNLGITEIEFKKLNEIVLRQKVLNAWFTEENVRNSLLALGSNMNEVSLNNWLNPYSFSTSPKRVAIIMAGNIPLVGFHDFLCVILSGNTAICKMSSDDKTLLPAIVQLLLTFTPSLENRIILSENKISDFDAVIATGSDNSLNYFNQYFGKYPHVFRKNRTSVAILNGSETVSDFEQLGHDIFDYHGLGCRNVSHLIVPKDYDFKSFFEGIVRHGNIINHFKYGNNYDYNKTVYLMNQHKMLDNNFVLLFESIELFSPLAMIYFHSYQSQAEIDDYLALHKDSIQAIVGDDYIPFGSAQCPALNDYADGFDTMEWLSELQIGEVS